MAITLENERKAGLPVVKRTALEQVFNGAIVNVEQRNRVKRDEVSGEMVPVLKPGGKPRQELVLTCLTLPGTTAPVGLGTDDHPVVPEHVPEEEIVRLILKGKAFADWILVKADLGRPVQVGDVVTQTTNSAQVYDQTGQPSGKEITKQAALNAVPRGKSVGIYGPIELRASDNTEWVAKAEAAYHAMREPITAEAPSYEEPVEDADVPPADDDSEPPF